MQIRVQLESADLSASIRRIEKCGILLTDMEQIGPYTICFVIPFRYYKLLSKISCKYGDQLQIIERIGLAWTILSLRIRPILMIGLFILLAISLWIPGRILFVQVEGNDAITAQEIVETASKCGIHFGSSRRMVRSEVMKNRLLDAMPQLQWAGINTRGCVAEITVRERNDANASESTYSVSSIVAARDGIIQQITVSRGKQICTVGDAVRAGQILVSGYNDCGICLQATSAEAEIYARTSRALSVKSPSDYGLKTERTGTVKKFSLIIGKKRINFYNSSGILGNSCAKIYEWKYVSLPGGFVLPVSIVSETRIFYNIRSIADSPGQEDMLSFAREYLYDQMVGGSIVSESWVFSESDDVCLLDIFVGCNEMIGLSRPEEILTEYESD